MKFYKVTVKGTFLPDAPGTRSLGAVGFAFLQIHSAEFVGALTGDVTGDIYCANGTDKILENGTTLAAADAYWAGDLMCIDGLTKLMDNKATPGAVTFLGTATKAKYA